MPSGPADRTEGAAAISSSDLRSASQLGRDGRAAGTLWVVATPIGNLGDLSPRAADTLRSAAVIAAEDTRRARTLLAHVGAEGKDLVRLDANASERDVARLSERIGAGEDVALVTDAGTPVVSDPGSALVRAVRAHGGRVVPVAGPSAVTAALSASGYEARGFRFVGFLPRTGKDRAAALGRIASDTDAVVLFESPHRMTETLADLARIAPARRALVARELTKLHEELLEGELATLSAEHGTREWLGEITMVLSPTEARDAAPASIEDLDPRIDALLDEGRRTKEIAELLALESGLGRREIYERVAARKASRSG
ncbi:MAG TPA: 16S rRNA (cytidine(1402)-2'-O)-methyltransferase [Polyangiaceae bacterium]|jgi:16S rRNA (cytidine1402-2'-O)-methyltransferase|nr:16S rRNA (cytidine(1402)-2'-O)-methyltransferase [Polyangiaceae bacterium]